MKYYKHHFLILNLVGLNCPLILLSERITQAFYSSYLKWPVPCTHLFTCISQWIPCHIIVCYLQ